MTTNERRDFGLYKCLGRLMVGETSHVVVIVVKWSSWVRI